MTNSSPTRVSYLMDGLAYPQGAGRWLRRDSSITTLYPDRLELRVSRVMTRR
jgi:hypothetical protein